MIKFKVVVAGTIETFDQNAFKANLAKELEGVDTDDIDLRVTAASISVEATIRAPADSAKQTKVLDKLTKIMADPAAASAALGITVEKIETKPAVATVMYIASPPAPPSPPPSGLTDGGIVGIVVGCIAAVAFVMGGLVLCALEKQKKALQMAGVSATPGQVVISTTSDDADEGTAAAEP